MIFPNAAADSEQYAFQLLSAIGTHQNIQYRCNGRLWISSVSQDLVHLPALFPAGQLTSLVYSAQATLDPIANARD